MLLGRNEVPTPAACALAANEIVGGEEIFFPQHQVVLLLFVSTENVVHSIEAAERVVRKRAPVHYLNAVD